MYHLAGKNTKKVVEEAIGPKLNELGMRYNKKHRYWYRITEPKVLQYLGLERSSTGGIYEFTFGCQPVFVPLCRVWYEDERGGRVPVENIAYANRMALDYKSAGIIDQTEYFRQVHGDIHDDREITENMQMMFEKYILPVFLRAVDTEKTFEWDKELKKLRMTTVTLMSPKRNSDMVNAMTSPEELLMLLYFGKFEQAKQRYAEDSVYRYPGESYIGWLQPLIESNDVNTVKKAMNAIEAENRRQLADDGFVLDY